MQSKKRKALINSCQDLPMLPMGASGGQIAANGGQVSGGLRSHKAISRCLSYPREQGPLVCVIYSPWQVDKTSTFHFLLSPLLSIQLWVFHHGNGSYFFGPAGPPRNAAHKSEVEVWEMYCSRKVFATFPQRIHAERKHYALQKSVKWKYIFPYEVILWINILFIKFWVLRKIKVL